MGSIGPDRTKEVFNFGFQIQVNAESILPATFLSSSKKLREVEQRHSTNAAHEFPALKQFPAHFTGGSVCSRLVSLRFNRSPRNGSLEMFKGYIKEDRKIIELLCN